MSPETLSEADLKSTLNLPKTGFPMKANLGQNEKVSRKRWDALGLYEKMLEKGEESFLLHDGPPYANGDIHMGHLLNKVLKDMVVRSQAMAGKKAPFRPGWDCHGLPIEYRVLSEKNRAEKLATLPKTKQQEIIRKESESYAAKCVKQQAEQMQALLTVADYPNPYLTM